MVRRWFCVAGVASARDAVSWHSSAATHLRESARAFFAIVAQVLLWYGVSSLYWVICLGGSGEKHGPLQMALLARLRFHCCACCRLRGQTGELVEESVPHGDRAHASERDGIVPG